MKKEEKKNSAPFVISYDELTEEEKKLWRDWEKKLVAGVQEEARRYEMEATDMNRLADLVLD